MDGINRTSWPLYCAKRPGTMPNLAADLEGPAGIDVLLGCLGRLVWPDLAGGFALLDCLLLALGVALLRCRLKLNGCDAVIAQGFEAGGHRGSLLVAEMATQVGTLALVPQVVDVVQVPVIGAGGIADARGIVAALALGASAVQIGTAYLFHPRSTSRDAASKGIARQTCRRDCADQRFHRTARTTHPQSRHARTWPNKLGGPSFPLASGALSLSGPRQRRQVPASSCRCGPGRRQGSAASFLQANLHGSLPLTRKEC